MNHKKGLRVDYKKLEAMANDKSPGINVRKEMKHYAEKLGLDLNNLGRCDIIKLFRYFFHGVGRKIGAESDVKCFCQQK